MCLFYSLFCLTLVNFKLYIFDACITQCLDLELSHLVIVAPLNLNAVSVDACLGHDLL